MKILGIFLAILTLVFFPVVSEARDIAKGSIMITGESMFDDNSVKMDTDFTTIKTNTTSFDVTASYFVTQNIGIGLMIGNEDSDTHYDSNTENSSIDMIGPMVTYSISLNPNFNLILNAGLLDISGDMDDSAGNSISFDGNGTFLLVSIAYFLNDSVAIHFGLRRIDANIDLKFNYLANPPVSADMSDNSNMIGFVFLF